MTRMWCGVLPAEMCDQHLLGEWNELHKIAGSLSENPMPTIMQGAYLNVDLAGFSDRALAVYLEMRYGRGFDPSRDLLDYEPPVEVGKVNADINRRALRQRCDDCAARMEGSA